MPLFTPIIQRHPRVSTHTFFGLRVCLWPTFCIGLLVACLLSANATLAAPKQDIQPTLAALYDAILPHVNRDALVLYVVPVATEGENRTDLPEWWKHCPHSEMVSEAGMTQARQMAAALKSLKLRVAIAQSAEICASLTTATFIVANPSVNIHPTPDLNPP